MTRRLPNLEQLCPYCAAVPDAGPCAEAQHGRHFTSYVHIGDPEWGDLLALDLVTTGLRLWAQAIADRLAPPLVVRSVR